MSRRNVAYLSECLHMLNYREVRRKKQMKNPLKYILILTFAAAFALFYILQAKTAEETIIFFPLDPSLRFESYSTNLTANKKANHYQITWNVQSDLLEQAYLRQDVSLLFKNGKLHGVLKEWIQPAKQVNQQKKFRESQSGLFESISFHYAEVHPTTNEFTSVQAISKDHLYVIQTPLSSFQFFREPISNDQKEWKLTIDKKTEAEATAGFTHVLNAFQINERKYRVSKLTNLNRTTEPFWAGFPMSKRDETIGKLWEGLYKNYILGIKKEDGHTIDPNGSTVPFILMPNDKSELLVLFTASDGTPILLRQKL
jgi:hypothetical protein